VAPVKVITLGESSAEHGFWRRNQAEGRGNICDDRFRRNRFVEREFHAFCVKLTREISRE
jgi:hypothetical protein